MTFFIGFEVDSAAVERSEYPGRAVANASDIASMNR